MTTQTSILPIVVLFLTSLGCAQLQALRAADAEPAEPPPSSVVREEKGFKLIYPVSLAAEAESVTKSMRATRQCLTDYLGAKSFKFLSQRIPFEIYLSSPNPGTAPRQLASTKSGMRDESIQSYYARLDLVALSAADGNDGQQVDYSKMLTTEYSHTVLDVVTRLKGAGWTFDAAPDWFVHGYSEWLGVHCLPQEQARERFKEYRKKAAELLAAKTTDPRIMGVTRFELLHSKFGKRKIQDLAGDGRESFAEAFKAILKTNQEQFDKQWESWLVSAR